jgi:predicted MFS family arabinose efflux permease
MANNIFDIKLLRAFFGVVSAAFWVAASTLIADSSSPERLASSMARYNISWITAFTVSPFLGGVISESYGFPFLFTTTCIVNLVSFGIIYQYIRPGDTHVQKKDGTGVSIQTVRNLFSVYLTLVPYALLLGIFMAILPGHMIERGVSTALVGVLITVTNGSRGIGFLLTERLVAWGEKKSLALASLLLCVSLFLIANAEGFTGFIVPMTLFGLGGGIVTPVILDCVARGSQSDSLGTALGTHEAIYGVGMCLGPVAGGLLAGVYSQAPFYIMLAIFSLTILPVSRTIRRETR